MKQLFLTALALGLTHLPAQAETLTCWGYQVSSEPAITVKGELKLDTEGQPTSATLLFESLGKEGWTYFWEFQPVAKDGSNFSKWFDHESAGSNFLVKGLYAGLSPVITEAYPLHQAILAGTPFDGLPKRTFIVFGADRKPYAETFCYEGTPKPRAENP